MIKNGDGFSIVELFIVVVIVGLIGALGWVVYERQSASNTAAMPHTATAKQANPYTFKELGVSMDILDGWNVTSSPTQREGANFYSWSIQKAGADAKIGLGSFGFHGGFEPCVGPGSLTPVIVKDIAPTQNANFMFLYWSYDYNNETNSRIDIVPTGETDFRTSNDGSVAAIKNQDIKAGNYFWCLSEPAPGFSLKLNNEPAASFSRHDSIGAAAATSSDDKYVPLPVDVQSYMDIKAMLTTIK
jgi:hypothetical protein